MDYLDILSTISDQQKATILHDALPHYYINKMKEANTDPIEMTPDELFQLALNIEEAAINP
jgi:hypothetical protein